MQFVIFDGDETVRYRLCIVGKVVSRDKLGSKA